MIETSELLMMLVLLLIIGGIAGVIAGLLGVGGGIILVPAFYFAFEYLGYDSIHLMQICLATSLATIIITSIRSVQAHHRKNAVDWSIIKKWTLSISLGAIVGVIFAARLSSIALMIIFGVLGICVGLYLSFGKVDWRISDEMPKGFMRIFTAIILGFGSVLMGIGGGSFGVPMMTLFNVPIHRAIATASAFGFAIALPSVIGFLFLRIPIEARPPLMIGSINLLAFSVIVFMTFLTTPIGVKIAHSMDPKPLKRIFGIFVLVMALNILRKAIWN